MKKYLAFIIFYLAISACSKKENKAVSPKSGQTMVTKDTVSFGQFTPDTLNNNPLDSFEVLEAYLLEGHKVLTGNYNLEHTAKHRHERAENDWGDRIIILNSDDEVVFSPKGATDLYLYEPHFYRAIGSSQILVVCQKGFEYFCGGEVFLLDFDNQVFKSIGELDVESHFEGGFEKKLVDVLNIKGWDNQLEFTFACDSLLYFNHAEEIVLQNIGLKYIYDGDTLIFNDPN